MENSTVGWLEFNGAFNTISTQKCKVYRPSKIIKTA